MNQLVLLALLVFQTCASLDVVDLRVAVIGGKKAGTHAYPYQISLQSKQGKHLCGGSLVKTGNGEIVVITASHCVENKTAANIQVKVGEYSLSNDDPFGFEKVYAVKKIVMHPAYNRSTKSNDVAILYLKDKVELNKGVQPVALTKKSAVYFYNKNCTITGWGSIALGGVKPDILQVATVDFFPKSKCKKDYGKDFIQTTMICGGKPMGGVDACQGDSGGPFVCTDESTGEHVLSGISSWGYGCALPGKSGVYTDVYMMRRWLKKVLKVSDP